MRVRGMKPQAGEAQRVEVMRDHLREVHQRAKAELAGWSGPYAAEQGDYFYNEMLKASSWESPVAEWETELATRHAVLSRCLLQEQAGAGATSACSDSQPAGAGDHHVD